MIPEIGQMALMLALVLAILQSLMPFLGSWFNRPTWVYATPSVARTQCVFLIIAFLLLIFTFVQNDFSVIYVAQNSNTALPVIYRISATWGGHEGSLLLWVLVLALWTVSVTMFGQRIPKFLQVRVLGILGLVSTGFLLLLICTSNPFERLIPAAVEGRDLNPLLQDPGLIIHPPMLYMGYVGFSVAFAFAVTALLSGRMDSAWARWARPWTLAAWVFLTIGITLGSWWAYYELGWGGWWFWDPVENASFMPWLAGTALIHSLAVTEARGLFKPWTALLAILTFALCLLGTFLVRSGVLTSVHSFATDPERGLFILVLLALSVGGSLVLYAWNAPRLRGTGQFALVSRESSILINNVFLTVTAFSVLLGTMYPLILEAIGFGKISVGPPYFNSIFIPLAGIPAALAAVGALTRWKRDTAGRLLGILGSPFLLALVTGVGLPLLCDQYQWTAVPGLILSCWILFATLRAGYERLSRGFGGSGGFWGMIVAHTGIAVFVAGVTIVSVYEQEKDVRLIVGERQQMGKYDFELLSIGPVEGENYSATRALIRVWQEQGIVAVLQPEKRIYQTHPDRPMTEAGITAGLTGDWYASLGEPLGDGSWSAKLQRKPFIRFIWGGALLMALGGIIAAADRRYFRRVYQ